MSFDIAAFMRALRDNLGMTQLEFSKQLGISRVMIANYEIENNSPSAQVFLQAIKLSAPDVYEQMIEMAKQARVKMQDKTLKQIETMEQRISVLKTYLAGEL
jgi:transcriptional regulator with XRE-family HTH domain